MDPITPKELITALSLLNPDAPILVETFDDNLNVTIRRVYGFDVSNDNSQITLSTD